MNERIGGNIVMVLYHSQYMSWPNLLSSRVRQLFPQPQQSGWKDSEGMIVVSVRLALSLRPVESTSQL